MVGARRAPAQRDLSIAASFLQIWTGSEACMSLKVMNWMMPGEEMTVTQAKKGNNNIMQQSDTKS